MENYIIANSTDTGRVRSVNEDSMATFESPNGRVMVVCDGMGGQNAGDVASQLAVAVIQDILTDNTFPTPEEAISRSIMAANQAILRRASQDAGLSGMGSTCVMLIIKGGQVYYGSVGDSRIYYVANNSIHQVTKDQSYVQTLVDEGRITQEAAEHHQDKNQITNALGLEGMTPPVICQLPITPEPGSVFILCSDGLSGMIHNNAILTTVTRYDLPLKERADMLVRQANEAGGLDNVTVQLVEFPGNTVAAQAAAASAAYAKSRKKKGNALVYTIVALLVVAVAGGLTFWFVGGDKEEAKPKVKPTVVTKPKQPATKEKAAQPTTTTTTETTTVIVKEEETPKATTKRVDKTKAITRKAKQVKEKTDATKDKKVKKALEEKKKKKNQEIEIKKIGNKSELENPENSPTN